MRLRDCYTACSTCVYTLLVVLELQQPYLQMGEGLARGTT
jgi:hypothetical protein